MDCLHSAQMKQAECQWRPSNDINLQHNTVKSSPPGLSGSPRPPLPSDGFGAAGASLGEEFREAVSTERLVLAAGKLLAGQGGLTAGADKALLARQISDLQAGWLAGGAYLVPGLPSEGDSAGGENIVTLHTLRSHFVLSNEINIWKILKYKI